MYSENYIKTLNNGISVKAKHYENNFCVVIQFVLRQYLGLGGWDSLLDRDFLTMEMGGGGLYDVSNHIPIHCRLISLLLYYFFKTLSHCKPIILVFFDILLFNL